MKFPIGIENNNDGRSIAWVLDHPGCYAYGADAEAALAAAPAAIQEYAAWINARSGGQGWVDAQEIQIVHEETWDTYRIDADFNLAAEGDAVESFFRYDWRPLSMDEIERAARLLSWSRADLLEAVRGLSPEDLEKKLPGERWPISGILWHVGGAEWWYVERIGLAFEEERLPKEPFERLAKARTCLIEALPVMLDSKLVVGWDGEIWSPRKVLRRALWHERDHTEHIKKLIR